MNYLRFVLHCRCGHRTNTWKEMNQHLPMCWPGSAFSVRCLALLFLLVLACGCDNAIAMRGDPGPEGPPGPQGARGPAGVAAELPPVYGRIGHETVEVDGDSAVMAECDDGDVAIGGGCDWGVLPLSWAGYPLFELDEDGEQRPTRIFVCITRDQSALSVVEARAVCLPGAP